MFWEYDKKEYKKQIQADPIWGLERFLNYGMEDEKLDRKLLEKYLPVLNIPQKTRDFLELLLWDKRY